MSNDTNDTLNSIIQDALEGQLRHTNQNGGTQYGSIEEYKAATGKRFRKTRDQSERGLTREEAFAEFQKSRQ